jgi:hypothetical protein
MGWSALFKEVECWGSLDYKARDMLPWAVCILDGGVVVMASWSPLYDECLVIAA